VIDLSIEKGADKTWVVNGRVLPGLEGCAHLDLSFTPATSFPQMQAIALTTGHSADLNVA
jgi:hypothetical protein